ncbi:MAG: putative prefoldin subunit 3 [Streblomastix strix]|nr:MAG: putative prefoldin subunit 3 [Streblomastix strix]
MERSLSNKAVLLERKVPEIQSTLKALDHLIAKKNAQVELTMDFLLSENVYSQAVVDNTGKVGIWLGANVMVEYSYDEAKALLERNLDGAEKQLKSVDDDLLFLKAQITTSEVAIARFFNFDVKQRRQLRAIQEKEDAAKK